jgi:hypothetical protein
MSKDKMENAYRVAHELLKDRLKEFAPQELKDIEAIEAADVLVVRGQYDHIETVFKHAQAPYTLIQPQDLEGARLRPDQILFINCPGILSPKALRKLPNFVSEGGFLFTTDWALKHVLEPAFPGVVEFNRKPTGDEVIRIEIVEHEDPFLKSILDEEDDPQWWLEGSSYPIHILDVERVNVLITSKELEERHGEAPVFITFDHGEGKVYHMISHFYLQRTETRTARHDESSIEYIKAKGLATENIAKYASMGAGDLKAAAVESALASDAMIHAVFIEKQRWNRKQRKKGMPDGDEKEGS